MGLPAKSLKEIKADVEFLAEKTEVGAKKKAKFFRVDETEKHLEKTVGKLSLFE